MGAEYPASLNNVSVRHAPQLIHVGRSGRGKVGDDSLSCNLEEQVRIEFRRDIPESTSFSAYCLGIPIGGGRESWMLKVNNSVNSSPLFSSPVTVFVMLKPQFWTELATPT